MMFTSSQKRTFGLHVVSAAGGAAAALTFAASQSVDLWSAWDHLHHAVKDITAAFVILSPIASTAWGVFKATTRNKLLDATRDPDAVEAAREIEPTPQVRAVAAALSEKP